MRGLLLEDDPGKASKILQYLRTEHPELVVYLKESYQSGIKELFEVQFDFVLLDMSLPTYDQVQGKPRNFGGRDVLKEMKRYGRKSKVKVITQYNEFDGGSITMKELNEQLKTKYSDLYVGYILYNHKQTKWQIELSEFIKDLI